MISNKNSILILGSFSIGALEHQYVRGLKFNGWKVVCLDIQIDANELKNKNVGHKILFNLSPKYYYKNINQKVLETAVSLRPQVILIFKGMELKPETIKVLKSNCSLLCNYNPDHPFKFYSKGAGNSNVADSLSLFDIYFSYSNSICKQLKADYNVTSNCIPFGYDETIKPIKSKSSHLLEQVLFIGAWDKDREQKIKNLTKFNLQVFGPTVWNRKLMRLKNIKYHDKLLYTQDYADACLSARGILNFLRPQNIIEQSHNMRTFEVPGYSGLLISERTEEQLGFFEEDKEAIYFDSIEELKDKLQFYKVHEGLVSKIKANGNYRSIKSGYGYQNRTKLMISYINKYLE
ncbi:glycosyltransferase [Pedobacter sp. Leaf250]|uniref:CgeB family protein n=1 Tax=Pedobacter sp. Leaf250 TaxID=2876559 RepID=UPI001E355F58|nr:glycosyltransferase [Pedobacter sp. Leaf250]